MTNKISNKEKCQLALTAILDGNFDNQITLTDAEKKRTSSVLSDLLSIAGLKIRFKTDNKCIFCNLFVSIADQSIEHVVNYSFCKSFGIGNQWQANLVLSHKACNIAYKQGQKPYNESNALNLETTDDFNQLVKIAFELYIDDQATAEQYLFNRKKELVFKANQKAILLDLIEKFGQDAQKVNETENEVIRQANENKRIAREAAKARL